jgi:predicted nucleic acid-binding protein
MRSKIIKTTIPENLHWRLLGSRLALLKFLGLLDRTMCKGRLTEEEHATARRRLLLETRRLMKLKLLLIVPLKGKLLVEAWRIVEKHHIYQVYALQIATAKQIACTEFLTGDATLHNTALKEGLNSICLS